jgi:hypothetical protein
MLEPLWELAGSSSPELSVLMPVYNRAHLVGEAIRSVLAQKSCVLELLISDDQSTDSSLTAALSVVKSYSGPHSIRVMRTRQRLAIEHLGALVATATHDFLVEAHDDDVSLEHRMAHLLGCHRRTGAALVTSLAVIIQRSRRTTESFPSGFAEGFVPLERFAGRNPAFLAGARYGLHRSVFESFPPLTVAALPFGHDIVHAARATLLGGVWLTPQHVLHYRRHIGGWSNRIRDWRSKEAADFGFLINQLGTIAVMRGDITHLALSVGADNARLAAARAVLDTAERQLVDRLVARRQDLRSRGYEPLWVTLDELAEANRFRRAPIAPRPSLLERLRDLGRRIRRV